MEAFDLGALERFANTGELPTDGRAAREMLFDLGRAARELRARRLIAENELRVHERNVAQIGSLKRRITQLRETINWGANTFSSDGLAAELTADDDRRRRFEKKQKAASRG